MSKLIGIVQQEGPKFLTALCIGLLAFCSMTYPFWTHASS